MTELAHLFAPITLRNLTIRNRIFSSAHVTALGEKGLPTDRHVRYYEARAKGGAADIPAGAKEAALGKLQAAHERFQGALTTMRSTLSTGSTKSR